MTTPLNSTSRDLLEYVAGPEHALHSVVSKERIKGGFLRFLCSCGSVCTVEATTVNLAALRNIRPVVTA